MHSSVREENIESTLEWMKLPDDEKYEDPECAPEMSYFAAPFDD